MGINLVLEPKKHVTAKNELFRCRCKNGNLIAARIFYAFASLIDAGQVEHGFVHVSIPASSVLSEGSISGRRYYDISKAADTLLDAKLEHRLGKTGFVKYNMFSSIRYENGILTGKIDADLIPFFTAIKEHAGLYTKLNFSQYVKLPSMYSQRLFAFLSSWRSHGYVEKNLDELHELLNTPDTLKKDVSMFRKRVLEKAHADISAFTDLCYVWRFIKEGRRIVSVHFEFPRVVPATKKRAETPEPEEVSLISFTPVPQDEKDSQLKRIAAQCWKNCHGQCQSDKQPPAICGVCRKNSGKHST